MSASCSQLQIIQLFMTCKYLFFPFILYKYFWNWNLYNFSREDQFFRICYRVTKWEFYRFDLTSEHFLNIPFSRAAEPPPYLRRCLKRTCIVSWLGFGNFLIKSLM